MKILTFDTALNKTYITFGEDDNILLSEILNSDKEKYHSAFLVPKLIDILKTYKIKAQDIDVIGINTGPGSFTGIRICTVIARTLAQQTNSKVIPVSSLEILSLINKNENKSMIFTDARKNKFYTAVYSSDGEVLKQPSLIEKEKVLDIIDTKEYTVITDDFCHGFLAENGISSINYEYGEHDLGQNLYKICLKKLGSTDDFHWAKAKPLYIQPPSITKSEKKGVKCIT